MKNILLALLVSGTTAFAQPYQFSTSNATYSALSGETNVNGTTVWSTFMTFNIPIGFNFSFMDQTFTTVDFEATGRLIFDADHYYFADMFVVNGLRDKGFSSSVSPISYLLTGTTGDQILKIQVSNATYAGDPTATIDFQIWLYESCSKVELHMGPNDIPSPGSAFPTGAPSSGVYHVSAFGPTNFTYALMAFGDEAAPQDSTFTGTSVDETGITLDDCPIDGTVYSYVADDCFAGISPSENPSINLYPNPADETVQISGLKGGEMITLYDLNGKKLLEQKANSTQVDLNVERILSGNYIIRVNNSDSSTELKLVKR